jgi:CHASE2 domain-containing sensor protein
MGYDSFLRLRPIETVNPLVVVVGINEEDIRAIGKYPIPDRDLARLLKILQSYQPRAIGLDIFRDLATGADRAELAEILKNSPNLIGIEAALGSQSMLKVKPPLDLPATRVGLADVILDPDGKLRRSLLASNVDSGDIKFSMPMLLAALYLRSEGISFKHSRYADEPIQLGNVRLPRFSANTGGYVQANAGGYQMLLHLRSNPSPFPVFSLMDVLTHKVKPDLIRDRIVLIGMIAASVNDIFMTSATKGTLLSNALNPSEYYQSMYGVEYQAHATSQLVDGVLHHRPFLRSWSDGIEYFWILAWGAVGISLGLVLQSPWKTLMALALSNIGLIGICYGLLLLGWWVPVVPTLLAICAAGLTTSFFDRNSRILLEHRSATLKQTYDAVHNGPLQTLAAILRSLDEEPSPKKLRSQLQALNQELRSVYESMHQALLTGKHPYAQPSMDELLYQVYERTLQRNLPGFVSIQTVIPPDFTLLKACPLTADQKQGLCLFLQEALCNVGNHAVDASRLEIVCQRDGDRYCLQIIDNGIGNPLSQNHCKNGRGTAQANELARSLRGKFQRYSRSPQGIVCELTWQGGKPWWQPFGSIS